MVFWSAASGQQLEDLTAQAARLICSFAGPLCEAALAQAAPTLFRCARNLPGVSLFWGRTPPHQATLIGARRPVPACPVTPRLSPLADLDTSCSSAADPQLAGADS